MANYITGNTTFAGDANGYALGNHNRRPPGPVGFVRPLKHLKSSETAETLLMAIVNIISPVMVKYGYFAASISEFQPEDGKMSQLIKNEFFVNSFSIEVRLRPLEPRDGREFLHIDDISITILGELASHRYKRGTKGFKSFNSQLQAEFCANQGIENVWKEFEAGEVSIFGTFCDKFKAFKEGLCALY